MIGYASRTGTRRNLVALRSAQWRLLISRQGVWRTEGFPYALDNGAWSDFRTGRDFDDERFKTLVDRLGGQADWIVAPDVVAGGLASLQLSLCWVPHLLIRTRLVLIAVQDGMGPQDLVNIVMPRRVGIFLGGSTEWKLATMRQWGEFCAAKGVYYHVARVNSAKRMAMAHQAGADSVDGSSASRYAVTLPNLDFAVRQWDMWAPPTSRERIIEWASGPARDVDDRGKRRLRNEPVRAIERLA
ncbi:MAG: hypothetical protein V4502_03875 [Pseudomonadota bacterium]